VLTSITLRLQGIPEKITGGVCTFDSVKSACDAVIMTIQMGIPVARIELLDEVQVRACNLYSGLSYEEKPTLFLEFHGTEETTALQSQQFSEIAQEFGGLDFRWTGDAQERAKLWKARHDAYWASRALAPELDGLSTDVCVPISRLADCVAETQKDILENGFLAPIVGHAGDGNFHVLILFDGKNAESIANTEAFVARLNRRALAMDGTCTGEHGIGQGKMSFLAEELGGALDMMRAIKSSLDPDNIFNPGKLFRAL
jgi:FAD/FMN-containing dehydrogenase